MSPFLKISLDISIYCAVLLYNIYIIIFVMIVNRKHQLKKIKLSNDIVRINT